MIVKKIIALPTGVHQSKYYGKGVIISPTSSYCTDVLSCITWKLKGSRMKTPIIDPNISEFSHIKPKTRKKFLKSRCFSTAQGRAWRWKPCYLSPCMDFAIRDSTRHISYREVELCLHGRRQQWPQTYKQENMIKWYKKARTTPKEMRWGMQIGQKQNQPNPSPGALITSLEKRTSAPVFASHPCLIYKMLPFPP